mmetsp:Transcript_15481/g.60529  ORF Transcript_15481/g.60529 Transcript_15481/m.60529 type:complete len:407 (+) Transcript_15481:1-1221(+)
MLQRVVARARCLGVGRRAASSWAVAGSFRADTRKATAACVEGVQDDLLGEKAELCMLQVGSGHEYDASLVSTTVSERLGCSKLFGSSSPEGGGAVAKGLTGISLAAVGVPEGVSCALHACTAPQLPRDAGRDVTDASDAVVVASPTFDIGGLLEDIGLQPERNGGPLGVVGGTLVPLEEGSNGVLVDGEWQSNTAVAALFQGKRMRTLVSHGCRAVGELLEVRQATKRYISEVVVQGGQPDGNKAVAAMYLELQQQGMLKDGNSMLLGVRDDEGEVFDEDAPASYTLYKIIAVSPSTGELELESNPRTGADITGKTVRFFVQTKDACARDVDSLLSSANYDDLPQSGAFLFSSQSRLAAEEEYRIIKQFLPSVALCHVVTSRTVVPRPHDPYATCTASVLAWWADD